jgi:hypothetical protein
MPDVKVPDFVADVYWDLRERRLLPLLALVVVAIVAVPFLLGGSNKSTPPPTEIATGAVEVETANASTLKVVQATPGLRDYRKRLEHRKPHNPFKQKFTGPVTKGAQLNPETSTTSSSTTTTSTTTSGSTLTSGPAESSPGGSSPPSAPANPGHPGGRPSGKPQLTFFTYAINVRIAKSGGNDAKAGKKQEPVVKKEVLPQTSLPGEKAPVVTYMGLARKGKKLNGKVLLLVSTDVVSVFGETHCVTGEEKCQLIEVEPGFPVTFVYGANEVHYTINVLKVDLVVTGHS